MSRATITESLLTDIADSIRAKIGGSDTYTPAEMATAIDSIPTGGGGSLQSKTATPTTSQQVVRPDAGYDGLSSVTVEAMPTGTAGTPTATKTVSGHTATITPSVTNTTGHIDGGTLTGSSVTVTSSELVSGTYNVTSSGTKDVTDYASASIPAGTEGTPTAAKGAVSNHSVSVTPSVTNGSGFIAGGTHAGSPVTVTASELVGGNLAITSNGTGIDVTDYETVSVDVPTVTPTGTIPITANGTYDVTNYASAEVDVSGGASNIVEGTFTGTTTGAAMSIDLGYTGNGYPIAAVIYPDGGMYGNTTFHDTIQRYAIGYYSMAKTYDSQAPTYSGSSASNNGTVAIRYKSSTSSATTFSASGSNSANIYITTAPSGSTSLAVKFSNRATMKVFIASTSYGFMANITYRYIVIYSE